jgi:hypothetical protein
MMACFHRLEDVSLDVLLRHDTVPLLSAYWDRLQARPTYQVAVVDWHDEENFRSAICEVYGDQRSLLHDQGISIMALLAGA